jgi:hypothetical protein
VILFVAPRLRAGVFDRLACYATIQRIVASEAPGTESAFPRLERIEHKMFALCEQKQKETLRHIDYWKRQAEQCQFDFDAAQERIKRSRLEFEETTAALENARAKIDSL